MKNEKLSRQHSGNILLAHIALKRFSNAGSPAVHSNIGSGYDDTEIADLTLSWMISKLQAHKLIDFLPEAVIEHRQLGVKWITNAQYGITFAELGSGQIV